MDARERTHQDVTTLYNITSSLYTSLNYQQIVLHTPSILANLRFTILYKTSCHACNGLHRHSPTGILSPHVLPIEYLLKMLIHNHAPTSFISRHTPLLQILMDPHFYCRWTISPTNWCTHKALHTTTQGKSGLQFSHTTWKLISMLQYRHQVFRHNLWWNKSSGNFRTGGHYMSTGKWTVLQY